MNKLANRLSIGLRYVPTDGATRLTEPVGRQFTDDGKFDWANRDFSGTKKSSRTPVAFLHEHFSVPFKLPLPVSASNSDVSTAECYK